MQTECASVTWEIIRQYSHWSDKKLTTMMSLTDAPENGFMLQHDFHRKWDMLAWTLAPVVCQLMSIGLLVSLANAWRR